MQLLGGGDRESIKSSPKYKRKTIDQTKDKQMSYEVSLSLNSLMHQLHHMVVELAMALRCGGSVRRNLVQTLIALTICAKPCAISHVMRRLIAMGMKFVFHSLAQHIYKLFGL